MNENSGSFNYKGARPLAEFEDLCKQDPDYSAAALAQLVALEAVYPGTTAHILYLVSLVVDDWTINSSIAPNLSERASRAQREMMRSLEKICKSLRG